MPQVSNSPMPVHQIWLSSDSSATPTTTPEMQSVQAVAGPGYKLWLQDDLRQLMRESYSKEVRWAYEKMLPFSYRADLGRVIVTHSFGGYYLDLSVYRPTLVAPEENVFVGFADLNNVHTSWKVANNYFFATANSTICENVIDQIVTNCRREYYGKDPHFPTGPSVLGRSLALQGDDLPIRMGTYIWLKRRRNKYLMPGVGIVGRGKIGGRFRGGESGVPGGNNYNKMWQERSVYDPAIDEETFE